jgi:hypothetical protein
MIKQFKIYYNKLKVILLENKYLKKVYKQQQPKTRFNNEILIQGIINLYIKDLLLKQKQRIMLDYENQQQMQQIYLKDPTFNHSQEHRELMRNLENLLDNLAKVNDALSEIILTETDFMEKHVKDVLNLISINPVSFKRKKII